MRLLVVLLLAVGIVFASLLDLPRFADAQEGNDDEAAAETARLISRLEADRDYDALYDLLHPDAQAIVPREAVVGWYEETFAGQTTEELTVLGVEFVDWTWEVTGETYPDAAEVSFEQPYWEDGEPTSVEDVLRLVESAGQWRWFFGRSREFVDAQITTYASLSAPAAPDDFELFIVAAVCETEPPLPPGFDGSDCRPAVGVAFEVRSSAGEVLGVCTAEADSNPHAASCSVVVPLSSSGTVTQEPATLPDGYAPRANPLQWSSPRTPRPQGIRSAMTFLNYPNDVPAPSATRTPSTPACELVELYPGYPGYRGYVTGLDGVGDHACLSELDARQPGFSKAEQDRLNLAAAAGIGLAGPPELWTWENWMAVEAERGLPPTCYSCALKAADARAAPTGTAVAPDDPRLLLDPHQPSPIMARYAHEHGVGIVGSATDYDFRVFAGMFGAGRHLNAAETIAVMEQLLGYWFGVERGANGSTRYMNGDILWRNTLDQGGYVPTPATANLDDQVFVVEAGAFALRLLFDARSNEYLQQGLQKSVNDWRLAVLSGKTSLGLGHWLRNAGV